MVKCECLPLCSAGLRPKSVECGLECDQPELVDVLGSAFKWGLGFHSSDAGRQHLLEAGFLRGIVHAEGCGAQPGAFIRC